MNNVDEKIFNNGYDIKISEYIKLKIHLLRKTYSLEKIYWTYKWNFWKLILNKRYNLQINMYIEVKKVNVQKKKLFFF